jgi:hypothetical protein
VRPVRHPGSVSQCARRRRWRLLAHFLVPANEGCSLHEKELNVERPVSHPRYEPGRDGLGVHPRRGSKGERRLKTFGFLIRFRTKPTGTQRPDLRL